MANNDDNSGDKDQDDSSNSSNCSLYLQAFNWKLREKFQRSLFRPARSNTILSGNSLAILATKAILRLWLAMHNCLMENHFGQIYNARTLKLPPLIYPSPSIDYFSLSLVSRVAT